jgi:Icc-related predicted phosphoesterase
MDLAHSRLEDRGVKLIVIPSNDDPTWVDPLLADRGPIVNADRRIVVADRVQIAGLGLSTPTPWDTPREVHDERIAEELDHLLRAVDPALPLVLDVHVPPYGTLMYKCPVIDRDLRPVIGPGGVLTAPVGSRALRDVILRDRPVLGLFGHVHEGRGSTLLGTTLCANPGSEAGRGKLLGFLADVGRQGVEDWMLTEG